VTVAMAGRRLAVSSRKSVRCPERFLLPEVFPGAG
jgi:hypothetical protein